MGFQHGLTGMNVAGKNLDLIGNNIANANTTGFKSSKAQFGELFASAVGTSSGNNVGQGVAMASIQRNFKLGGTTITGNDLDMAVNGNGFFQLRLPDNSVAYTRAGSFQTDKNGVLVNADGATVMGYATDPVTGKSLPQIGPIKLPMDGGISGKKTDSVTVSVNLDAQAKTFVGNAPDTTYSTSMDVFNSQGAPLELTIYYTKTAANTWDVHTSLPGAATTKLTTLNYGTDGVLATPVAPATLAFKDADGTDINAEVDFTKTSQYASGFAINRLTQTGFAPGFLNGLAISEDGNVTARYSNGTTLSQGQLVLANFSNVQGLAGTSGGNWVETPASGAVTLGSANVGSFGGLQSGALEDSNVDLTAELVNMMTAQRAYQANAQTLKTQDQVASTLVNLR